MPKTIASQDQNNFPRNIKQGKNRLVYQFQWRNAVIVFPVIANTSSCLPESHTRWYV